MKKPDWLERKKQRLGELTRIRQPRLDHWRKITEYLIPYAGLYLKADRDSGASEYQRIIDETGIQSLHIAQAGLNTLRTNPSVPFFKSQTPDDDLNLYDPARHWLRSLDDMARRVLRKSRSYLAFSHLYGECLAFGTGATVIVDDFYTIVRHDLLTAGEYLIGTDSRGQVNTLYREFKMSAFEMVEQFGLEAVSASVKNAYGRGHYDAMFDVVHAIEPRHSERRNPNKRDPKNMPFESVYFEPGESDKNILREGGFNRFPCVVPRWRVTGNYYWGEGQGTIALGSISELQEVQIMKAKVLDHTSDPALQIPPGLRSRDRQFLPGGRVEYDQATPHGGVRRLFDFQFDIRATQDSVIQDIRQRIENSFFVRQFQPLTMISDTTMRTAAEILRRSAESLTVLGPVDARLQAELDEPLLNRIYERIIEEGLIGPPPPELGGMPIDIEFIGPMAQALKSVEANSQREFRMHLGEIAQLSPNVIDNYNADSDIRRVSDSLGIHPDLIVAGEQVALIRESRAAHDAALAQNESMATQAGTMKDVASAAAAVSS